MQKTLLIFHLLFISIISAQTDQSNFVLEYITTNQGLPHDYVTSIISDDLNAKWIGTENGLTKYNGYDFENIKPGKSYKKLKNENIEVLFKDDSNLIWIGTKSGGISSLDVKTNTVKNYNHLIDKGNNGDIYITAIAADQKGNIWIGTWEDGVFVINSTKNKLVKHIKISSIINSIISDGQSNIWISYYQRVSKFNTKGELLRNYNFKTNLSDLLLDSKRNKLWIGTSLTTTKLYNYDFKTQKIDSIETGVSSNFYKTLSLDSKNRLWIGTWLNGLYRSNSKLTKFSKIELVSPNSGKLKINYNTILKVHHDKNNQIWVATANGGVVKLIEGKGFKNASELVDNKSLNGDLNFGAIYKNKNSLFVGTLNNGVYSGTNFSNLTHIKEIGLTKIISLYEHQNKLYIGTGSSFYVYDLKAKKIIFTSKKIIKVTSFYVDKNNILFIGTQLNGIAVVALKDFENENAYRFYSDVLKGNFKIENSRITSIKEDSKGNIWVGTYNGLHLFDRAKRKFNAKSLLINHKLPSVIINSVVIKDDYIWLATPSGLIKLAFLNKKLIIKDQLTKEDGLNSDFICSVAFDAKSNIWLSTKTEIVKYNEQKHSFISYGENDGVKTTSFNNRSRFNFENNLLFFGGIDNVTYFNPNKIAQDNSVLEVIFTNLRVNNSLVQYSTEKREHQIIDKNFSYVDKIQLTHDDKFFSVGFITNDFSGKLNVKYRYKLEGYQNNWLDLQSQNEINFAGLDNGKYILKVAATRDNQTWSKSKNLEIEILNSPWKSPLAIALYTILILILFFYILKLYNDQLKLENNLEIARNDKEKEIELSELKLNFFTNISHEFRTPLTLIISPLTELMENPDLAPKMAKKLSIIDRNANRLLNLINQLLDFRKAEYGLLELSVSQGNIVRFSKEVFLYFNEMAKSRDIKYKFKYSDDEIFFQFDRNKIEIVLCNLLSNAIKYCKPGDKITLSLEKKDDFCIISVQDTGLGMEEDYLDKIFDHFFQIKSAESTKMIGSGIGLTFSKKIIELHHGTIEVESKINCGTEFLIKLPLSINYDESGVDTNFVNTDNIVAYDTKWNENQKENLSIKTKENSILIIDDNKDILDYLKDFLSDSYTIFMAENGNEGFKIASSEIPDLILSDIMMPGKDGITLCKELKAQIITSHIPIILLTARSSAVYEIQGLQTGADDYITKPFNPIIIKARIAGLLENRKKLRALLLNKIQFEPTQTEIENDTNTESAFIHKAIVLVETNIQNSSFSIETMVDELNMSQSTLYRKIKSLTGLSLTSFIRSIRLKKAAHLILIDDLNLSQIAYEVGFNDYKYFKISFEKQFKCLPSKYKAKITSKKM
ncbi:two-component regulator propeller domain-containing protein [Flavobacterium sp.]|uniref:two-component regulator propeller domain-containing protein n=1 Tax=Flavobacterium sp. TaxID=239 RepID=UPI00286AF9F8|nr:two-component regulator propeller domain-containing protein [Flavobacterium sp.]